MIMRSDGTITKAYNVEKEAEARGYQKAIDMLFEAQKKFPNPNNTFIQSAVYLSDNNPYGGNVADK